MARLEVFTPALLLAICLSACGIDDLPQDTGVAPGEADQVDLVTTERLEADQSWEKGIDGQQISWRYNNFRQLRNSIEVIGLFNITFVNTNPDDGVGSDVLIRFIGADGFQHLPLTPFKRVEIPANSSARVSETFILEVKDPATANRIEKMTVVLF